MDFIKCENSWKCCNHDSKYCYECKENQSLKSYFELENKDSCVDEICEYNINYKCKIKSLVENEGYGCPDASYL
jgi:hypothetical protein